MTTDHNEAMRLADSIHEMNNAAYMTAIANLRAERDTLRAEVERLRVNAERYEWLRDCHPADKSLWVAMGLPHAPGGVSCWRNDELDTAIDTARKEAT